MVQTAQDLVIRYYEKVLGVKRISSAVTEWAIEGLAEESAETADQVVMPNLPMRFLLVDIGAQAKTPSLIEMSERLAAAVKQEWLKLEGSAADHFEWVSVEMSTWREELQRLANDPANPTKGLILFGANGNAPAELSALLAPGLQEIQASPMIKRDAWKSILSQLRNWKPN